MFCTTFLAHENDTALIWCLWNILLLFIKLMLKSQYLIVVRSFLLLSEYLYRFLALNQLPIVITLTAISHRSPDLDDLGLAHSLGFQYARGSWRFQLCYFLALLLAAGEAVESFKHLKCNIRCTLLQNLRILPYFLLGLDLKLL